jgi:hypothetical protein
VLTRVWVSLCLSVCRVHIEFPPWHCACRGACGRHESSDARGRPPRTQPRPHSPRVRLLTARASQFLRSLSLSLCMWQCACCAFSVHVHPISPCQFLRSLSLSVCMWPCARCALSVHVHPISPFVTHSRTHARTHARTHFLYRLGLRMASRAS